MKLDSKHLYTVCEPAIFDRPLDNLRLAQNLFQLMIREHGIGLAANQAGVNVRLFVMYVEREAFHCFNPEIIKYNESMVSMKEGCLSFPDQQCEVARPSSVLVKYANARGQYQEREFYGLAARCFQHELDHLDGHTMHDRMTNVQEL